MKHPVKAIGIGIGIGFSLLGIQKVFCIEDVLLLRFVWIGGAGVVIGTALFNLAYHQWYWFKMKPFLAMLEAGNAAEYIAKMEAILPTIKGNHTRRTHLLNLSAGYADLGENHKAKEILESLTGTLPKGMLTDIHALNLCLTYFILGDADAAMKLYSVNKNGLTQLRKLQAYGGNVRVLEVYVYMHEQDYAAARLLLTETIEMFPLPRLQGDYQKLAEKLEAITE